MADRPQGRKKKVTEGGSGVHRRGEGLGSGPVGNGGPNHGKEGKKGYGSSQGSLGALGSLLGGSQSGQGSGGFQGTGGTNGGFQVNGSGSGSNHSQGGGRRSPGCLTYIVILIVVIFLANMLFSGACNSGYSTGTGSGNTYNTGNTGSTGTTTTTTTGQGTTTSAGGSGWNFGSYGGYTGSSANGWAYQQNTGVLDTSVAAGSRAKRTVLKGDGSDAVTVMVFMCGADLESKSAMASHDLQEMLNATNTGNINLIIYTGGASKWQNNIISSKTNQIYRIANGQITCLEQDMGSKPMTDPNTLVEFINWTKANYPANRNALIFWDHGGGSTTGYGYDEKYPREGSMDLVEINSALKSVGMTWDFIGFDTCLMATVENAIMLSQYADYMIASEETEPGTGWYHTDYLSALGANPSISTLELGKIICDSFTTASEQGARGQSTTLSVVDLAELSNTVPSRITAFSQATSDLIQDNQYRTVSTARSGAREFATSSRIDQVDLIHLAENMGTQEGQDLANALLGAVKYNRTSSNMTNAYGISIYFPYKSSAKVDSMVKAYSQIGMDSAYSRCIQQFASQEVAGQVASGGSYGSSPLSGLLGELLTGSMDTGSSGSGSGSGYSGSGSSGTTIDLGNAADIASLLGTFLGSDFSSISGLSSSNTGFLSELDVDRAAQTIVDDHLAAEDLVWTTNAAGEDIIALGDDQWNQVSRLTVSMFYDDGTGYVDLGEDNTFDYDEDGNLLAPADKTWLSINGQPVAFYVLAMGGTEDAPITIGRVPARLTTTDVSDVDAVEADVNLILVFDAEHEDGYVAGVSFDYTKGEDIETIAKNLTELKAGDQLDFVCDYYDYDGNYQDSYLLGDTLTVEDSMANLEISNTYVGDDKVLTMFCFTDLYGQDHWTPALELN